MAFKNPVEARAGQARALAALAEVRALAQEAIVKEAIGPTRRLFEAIRRDDIPGVRRAASDGADMGARDEEGKGPLERSCSNQMDRVLRFYGAR